MDAAIKDYNGYFATNYDTSSDKFPNYYKDVCERMKKRELDMLIVVNMFHTGFDAPTLRLRKMQSTNWYINYTI